VAVLAAVSLLRPDPLGQRPAGRAGDPDAGQRTG
jgi:hypothetical protein